MIDIADSTHRIESLKNLISCKRNTINTFHNKCDNLALACEMGIEGSKTRTFKLQGNHNNVLSESTSDYFEKVVTIPLLDHLTVEIESHLAMLLFQFIVVLLLSHQKWYL